MSSFVLPQLTVNPSGWGPLGAPPAYERVPFAAFNKGDRLGKCADFGGFTRQQNRARHGRGEENVELNYRFDVEEAREFAVVEGGGKVSRRPAPGTKVGASRTTRGPRAAPIQSGRPGQQRFSDRLDARNLGQQTQRGNQPPGGQRGGQGQGQGQRGGQNQGQRRPMEASVKVEPDWLELEAVDFSQLAKLSSAPPSSAEDMRWAGALETYDEEYDRIQGAKAPKKLRRFEDKDYFAVSAVNDSVMEDLAGNEAGNVFATDAVLAQLMASSKSIYPWDIVLTYLPGGIIFIDSRDQFAFEMHTDNETAHNMPKDEPDNVNSREALSMEATLIHQAFTQQALLVNNNRSAAEALPALELTESVEPNPFFNPDEADEGHQPAAICYRYRKWKMSGDIELVVRTQVHAVQRRKAAGAAPQLLSLYTLHEWDAKEAGITEWRKTMSQMGNLLASEMKNNANKLAKFTVQSLLAGVDSMRLGLVSRATRTDPDNHVILGTYAAAPSSFAAQMALSLPSMWGVLRWVVETVRKHAKNLQEDTPDDDYMAKFVLMRDPNKPQIRLYNVPLDAFDREAEGGVEAPAGGWGAEDGAAEETS